MPHRHDPFSSLNCALISPISSILSPVELTSEMVGDIPNRRAILDMRLERALPQELVRGKTGTIKKRRYA